MISNDRIERLIENEVINKTFPGIVILVRKKEKIVLHIAKGFRQIYPNSKEINTTTVFDLASLTKPLATTITALSVFEKEGISPIRKACEFIPELTNETADVNLFQLFTHTSGLPPVPEIFRLFQDEDGIDQKKALDHLFSLKPIVKPGTEVVYSCTGYILLTQILQRLTGKSLPELFKELVTDPGFITGLEFNPSKNDSNIAATEYCPWRKRWLKGEVHDENSFCLQGFGGNAGLFGNASGVMKLLALFRNRGILNDTRILSEESVRLMTANQISGLSPKRAFGFLVQDEESFAGSGYSQKAYGHTGFTGTSVWVDPDRELEYVVLTNRVHLGRDTNTEKIKSFRKIIHRALVEEFYSKN
jgi:serine-type D-Ala-D-Ala carboxypeptidase